MAKSFASINTMGRPSYLDVMHSTDAVKYSVLIFETLPNNLTDEVTFNSEISFLSVSLFSPSPAICNSQALRMCSGKFAQICIKASKFF
ncbi:Uncharacterised protein [Klebsiella pneumoniae]|nr:Uncharacterised protein [Klebsiella pneumoniae]